MRQGISNGRIFERKNQAKHGRQRSMANPSAPSISELLGLKCVCDKEALRTMLPVTLRGRMRCVDSPAEAVEVVAHSVVLSDLSRRLQLVVPINGC